MSEKEKLIEIYRLLDDKHRKVLVDFVVSLVIRQIESFNQETIAESVLPKD